VMTGMARSETAPRPEQFEDAPRGRNISTGY
jgi:hypothetical protein